MATIRPFSGSSYYKNLDRAEDRGVDVQVCCVHCGKVAKTAKLAAYLTCGGAYEKVPRTDEERGAGVERGDLGFYLVGSECAKLLKGAGVDLVPRGECGL